MKITNEEALADIVVQSMNLAIDGPKVKARFEAMEARLAAVEARPLQKWAGIHAAGVSYAEASLVTRNGSLWVSTKATTTTPGTEGSDWRLIVKKGGA